MPRSIKLLSGLILLALLFAGIWHFTDRPSRFPGLAGPAQASALRAESPTSIADFEGGAPSRIAILLTEKDSSWLGLVHGLKSFGIPFAVTEDFREAFKHRVVMVYPVVSGKSMSAEALSALSSFTAEGGTLIATNVLGGGVNALFGFSEATASKAHTRLTFGNNNAFIARYFGTPTQGVPFGSAVQPRGSYGYTQPTGAVLASYEDGTPALISRDTGAGRTYALGLDIGALSLLGYNNRQEDVNTSYVNTFAPGMDVLYLWLKDVYQQQEPDAVILGTVPEGKRLSILLTHDIDFTQSINNAITYAQYQKHQGVAATYFIQTKYVRDWNDDVFFNLNGAARSRQLNDLGMEVASHSVAHSVVFSKLPPGTGQETYPGYEPFVKSRKEIRNATVMGELRVSKYLLEATVPGLQVTSFRPGHLENPDILPQALEATGYRFSSSTTANNSLTHMPFRLNYNHRSAAETSVFEFPITIEDEAPPLMGSRLPQAIEVAEKIQRYGGLFVVLTHPNVVDHKFEFMRGLIEKMKPNAWFGTLGAFGQWWSARDRVTLDVRNVNGLRTVIVRAPETVTGLTLELPAGWRLNPPPAVDNALVQSGRQLLLPRFKGELQLQFSL
jgi:hypothetical protein